MFYVNVCDGCKDKDAGNDDEDGQDEVGVFFWAGGGGDDDESIGVSNVSNFSNRILLVIKINRVFPIRNALFELFVSQTFNFCQLIVSTSSYTLWTLFGCYYRFVIRKTS